MRGLSGSIHDEKCLTNITSSEDYEVTQQRRQIHVWFPGLALFGQHKCSLTLMYKGTTCHCSFFKNVIMEIITFINVFSIAEPFCMSLALSEVGILNKDHCHDHCHSCPHVRTVY